LYRGYAGKYPDQEKTMATEHRRNSVKTPSGDASPRLRIRLYRHGLGDCLLLRFSLPSGKNTFNVLIDCGLITVATEPRETMLKVVEDIAEVCKKRIDVVVMTHEHWDHASGFSSQQAREVFDKMSVGEVWYAWTEDPQNPLGNKLRKERAEKVKALAQAVDALGKAPRNSIAFERSQQLNAVLGFFGIGSNAATEIGTGTGIGKTRDAFEYLMNRRGVRTRFCYPDHAPLSLGEVENVRVFVLGPPEDEAMIKKSAPTKRGREVYELAAESNLANNLGSAFNRMNNNEDLPDDHGGDCPFEAALHRRTRDRSSQTSPELSDLIDETWDDPDQSWRKIEDDWTQAAESLALNLDTHTNNSGLVLAFEFVDTGDVFLFPADAQVGNWLSWQDRKWRIRSQSGTVEVTGPELLNRTVFYKVGHHGSHNATLRSLGLEQMTSDGLVAFIPVSAAQASKYRWNGMPFEPLLKRLKEKTGGRVLRSDGACPGPDEMAALPEAVQQAFLDSVKVDPDDLYFEYSYG
jgi:hypothetical protein